MKQKIFFDEINDFNIEIKYPEYKQEFYKHYTMEYQIWIGFKGSNQSMVNHYEKAKEVVK